MSLKSGNRRAFLITIFASVLLASAHAAVAQIDPEREEAHVYIKMDFWEPVGSQTAEAWHFDPNNNEQWTRLPNKPYQTIARAQFEVQNLFPADDVGPWMWFLGVTHVAIQKGEPGNFTDVSNQPAYSQMIDRMVMGLDGEASSMNPDDPCGDRIWPIAVGSSLTICELWKAPERPWGMRMVKEELLGVVSWQWENPTGVEEEDVYLDLTLLFDKVDPALYTNVFVSWISAGGGCGYDFCVNSNQQVTKTGTPVSLNNGAAYQIVGALPLTLDHTSNMKLYKRENNNDTLLITTLPVNSNNFYSAHKCQPDGSDIEWHNHSIGSSGHLQVGGVSAQWGYEALLDDTTIFTTADFVVPPHETFDPFHTVATPINCRAVYVIFWYSAGSPGG